MTGRGDERQGDGVIPASFVAMGLPWAARQPSGLKATFQPSNLPAFRQEFPPKIAPHEIIH